MGKKRLWGREFTLVKDGLAEEDVESLIRSLGASGNNRLEQAHHLNKLKDLSERMNGMVSEVTVAIQKLQEDSVQRVEQEKESMLAEAKKASDSIVFRAKVAAQSVMEEAEGVKSTTLAAQEEAEDTVIEAKERAKGIVIEAKEKVLALEEEAKKQAKEAYGKSKEQAETLMANGFERIQRLMESESESLLQSLSSMRKSPSQMKSLVATEQDNGATPAPGHSNEDDPTRVPQDKKRKRNHLKPTLRNRGSELKIGLGRGKKGQIIIFRCHLSESSAISGHRLECEPVMRPLLRSGLGGAASPS